MIRDYVHGYVNVIVANESWPLDLSKYSDQYYRIALSFIFIIRKQCYIVNRII